MRSAYEALPAISDIAANACEVGQVALCGAVVYIIIIIIITVLRGKFRPVRHKGKG